MRSYWTLFRLELKARFGARGMGNPVFTVIKTLIFLALVLLVYMAYIFGVKQLIEMFYLYDMSTEFLVLFISISQVLLVLFGISSVIKNLFRSGDNELLMRFPVSAVSVFAAKISIFVLYQVIFTVLVELPVFIMFGITTAQGWSYYALLPVVLVFSIILPLAISNLLAIPVMQISSRTKNMFALSLLISVIMVAAGFAIYMNVIQGVVDYMKEEAMSFFSKKTMVQVSKASKYIYPSNWFAYMLIGKWRLGASLLSFLVVSLFAGGAVLLNKKLYFSTILRDIEGSGATFTKVTKNKMRSPMWATFRREFLDIFRSSNYSFQYLCMAVAAPVMVFCCNRLASSMGENTIGAVIVPALALMVMMIFCAIILSFAASSVSREGENFYLTKIVPLSYRTQVLIKLALYMAVSTLSLLVTAVLIWVTGQIEVRYAFEAAGIAFLTSVAITCFAIKLDIKRPQFAVGGDGELSVGSLSTFVTLFIGFTVSVLYGLFGMVGIFLWGTSMTFGILVGVSGGLALLAALWLMIGLNKRYERITQR